MYNFNLKENNGFPFNKDSYYSKNEHSAYVVQDHETDLVSFNEDNFKVLRKHIDAVKEYIFCFHTQFAEYTSLLERVDYVNDEIRDQLNTCYSPKYFEPKFKRVGSKGLLNYVGECERYSKQTMKYLIYLVNQLEKNENKFPEFVYSCLRPRLDSKTFMNFIFNNEYKSWLESKEGEVS